MATRLNPDAHAAVQAARDGRCKDAMKYLYDAAPHMQASCGSESFERAVSDYRHVLDKAKAWRTLVSPEQETHMRAARRYHQKAS